ncbi:MAG: YceI family protein [Betaproteobacteria bacterium]
MSFAQRTVQSLYFDWHSEDRNAIEENAAVKFMMRCLQASGARPACLMLVLAGLAAGCVPSITQQAEVGYLQAPADFPEAYYRQAEALGRKVMRIDPQQSLVTIDVRRGGPLARLGHDHVVTSHDVRGYVDVAGGRADLYVPLDRLTVDEPDLRSEAGLAAQPSKEAVEGTRRNMLEKVLETSRFPFAQIRATRGADDPSKLVVTITLHGATQTFEIPAQIETHPGGIRIGGQMKLNQTDFGIVPLSVLGGGLQVQDRVDMRFRIFAGEN